MLLRIRSIFLFFLLLFSFSSVFSQTIEYNKYKYSPSFIDRIRQIGFWFYYQARLSGYRDSFHVPIRVRVQEAYDFIFVSLFSSATVASPTDLIVLQSSQYCPYNCNVCGYGAYSVTFFGCQNRSDPVIDDSYLCGVDCCLVDNARNPAYFVAVNYSQYCGNYYWDNLHYLLSGIYGADLPTGSGWVRFRDGTTRNFRVYSFSGRMRQNYSERVSINLPNVGGGILYSPSDASVVLATLNQSGISTSSLSSQPGFTDFLDYFQRGRYIDGTNSVVGVSTNVYSVPISSFSQIVSSDVFVSTSVSVSSVVVNVNIDLSTTNALLQQIRDRIDLSTTNNILSRIDQHLSSEVYVSSVGLPSQVFDVLYQASSTVYGIYDDIKSWFSVNFGSDTWDCIIRFGSFSFLGFSVSLPDVDLCSEPPSGLGLRKFFDLLVFLIRFSVIGWAIHILLEGFSSG